MAKRYASWGSDKSYRWLWRAVLQDAIFAFKSRMNGSIKRKLYCDGHDDECDSSTTVKSEGFINE